MGRAPVFQDGPGHGRASSGSGASRESSSWNRRVSRNEAPYLHGRVPAHAQPPFGDLLERGQALACEPLGEPAAALAVGAVLGDAARHEDTFCARGEGLGDHVGVERADARQSHHRDSGEPVERAVRSEPAGERLHQPAGVDEHGLSA